MCACICVSIALFVHFRLSSSAAASLLSSSLLSFLKVNLKYFLIMCNHVLLHATSHKQLPNCTQSQLSVASESRIRISGAFQCNVTRSCERVVSPLLLPSLLPPLTSLCSLLPATASHISWPHLFCLIWSVFCFGFYYFFVYCLLLYSFVFPFGQRISLSTAFRMHFSSPSLALSLSRQQVGRLIDNFDFSS